MTLADTVRPKIVSGVETVTKRRMLFCARRERYVTSHQFRNYFSAIQKYFHITLTNAISTMSIVPLKENL
jgi:hypothetical protein